MRYVIKKLGALVLTLLVVSVLAFIAFQIIPGDPTTRMLGTSATPERIEALRTELGLDRPVVIRYIDWLSGFFGSGSPRSYSYSMPVSEMLADKIPVTATLSIMAFVLVIVISIPIALYSALKFGGVPDRIITVTNQIVMAIPPFFISMLLIYLFGIVLKIFSPSSFSSFSSDPWGHIIYLLIAALAIALPKSAMTIKLLRGSILDEMRKDYIRTAYSRGNSRRRALYRHALKNASLPLVTFLALTLADIVAGSVIVEQVFAIPGIGRLLLSSIATRDFPVVQSLVVLMSSVVIGANFLADIINQHLDMRMRT